MTNPHLTVSLVGSKITDESSNDTCKLIYEMLNATGFLGSFKLSIITKSKGTGEHRGTVHLKRGHPGGVEVVSQYGDNDSCYVCTLTWEQHSQTQLLFDLSARLGQKKMFYGKDAQVPKVSRPALTAPAEEAVVIPPESELSAEGKFALTVLRSLGETWFSFGNVWKSVFVSKGIQDKRVAQDVLKYLLDQHYLGKTGKARGTRYQITELGKKARKADDTAPVTKPAPKVVLPEEDEKLSPAQIQGLHMRSDEYAEAHVQVTRLNEHIATAEARKADLESQLRGLNAELAAHQRDIAPYHAIMQDPDYRRDHERYLALVKKKKS